MKNIHGLNLATTKRELNQQIDRVGTTGKAFQDAVHVALCSSLYHVEQECETGSPNVDRFRSILLKMPKGTRRVAAGDWLKKVAPVSVSFEKGNGEVKVAMLKGKARAKHKGFQLEFACLNPFWEVEKPEVTVRPIIPAQLAANAVKAMRKALNGEGKRPLAKGVDVEDTERLAAGIEALIA